LVVTLCARGTNDENVTAEDRATFAGLPTVHDETEQTGLKKVRELM
jgi:hypothetical protein